MGCHQSRSKNSAPALGILPSRPAPPQKNLGRRFSRKFGRIADEYQTLDQVQQALRHAGLESSNLIVGIDFTKSNEWTGKHSYNGRSLHALGEHPNPYEQVISIIGRTLAAFDEDNLIPCFGFGDASTHDQYAFSFSHDHHPSQGFDNALARYRQIVPNLKLAGPTSFAPVIEAAVRTVEKSGGQYHVLVIIADGQVTRSLDTSLGNLSPQEKSTIDAIVMASHFPLSIVLVGVGDGPWDMMREFDDNLPARAFDNFQFVNYSEILTRGQAVTQQEALFALAALMEIPQQYKATMELGLLGRQTCAVQSRAPLPPPPTVLQADMQERGYGDLGSFSHSLSRFNHGSGMSSDKPQYPPVDPYSTAASEYKERDNKNRAPNSYPPKTYPPLFPPPSVYGHSDQTRY